MELKLPNSVNCLNVIILLIVPYGIETMEYAVIAAKFDLLIVPYGIETMEYAVIAAKFDLLIVPYGIETADGITAKAED